MALIQFLNYYDFLLYLFAAFLAWRGDRSNRRLAVGLGIIGGVALAWQVTNGLEPSYETIRFLAFFYTLVRVFGLVLIILGVSQLSSVGPGQGTKKMPGYSYLNPKDAPMASLVIPRNDTNTYTRGEELRDALYDRIMRICSKSDVNVIGYKSPERSGALWVRFDYQIPQDHETLSLRASLIVTIDRFDYHRYEHLLTVQTTVGTKSRTKAGYIELVDHDVASLNAYLAHGDSYPILHSRRTRTYPLQLWLPRNKVAQLDRDWITIGLSLCLGLGIFLFGPFPTMSMMLMLGSVLALIVLRLRRKTYILTTGKPRYDPRLLMRMDSWQVNIDGLGLRKEEVREALLDRLNSATDKGIQVVTERIWYPGIDGKVEREQIVCTYRRAVVFLHIEAYGNDIYVGWDSHVNAGTWMEQTLSTGVDRRSGKYVLANRVITARQAPNEYDITDANFITEWLHASIVKVLRLKMEEYKIDQEIDFKIQRESRSNLLGSNEESDQNASAASKFFSRLRRVQ